MILHAIHVLKSQLREHAKRGSGIAQALTGEKPRSPHWPTIEKRWKKAHPICAGCGSSIRVQVHHVKPFHLYPELELQDGTGIAPATGGLGATPNFVSLCMDKPECHLELGHGGNFRSAGNPTVLEDSATTLRDPSSRASVTARIRLATVASMKAA